MLISTTVWSLPLEEPGACRRSQFIFRLFYRKYLSRFQLCTYMTLFLVNGKSRLEYSDATPWMVRAVVPDLSWISASLLLLNICLQWSFSFPFGEMVGKLSFPMRSAF